MGENVKKAWQCGHITQTTRKYVDLYGRAFDQIELLKDHADLPADITYLFAGRCGNIHVIPYDLPGGGLDQAVDAAQQG